MGRRFVWSEVSFVTLLRYEGRVLIHNDMIGPSRSGPIPPSAIRTLKLPMSIHPHEISALALDDANGVIGLATTRSELWLLDYAITPASVRAPEFV